MSNGFLDISQLQIIGSGLRYPNLFDVNTGGLAVSKGEDRINQSIFLILSTPKGTRLFMPEFGSDLQKALFDSFVNYDLIQHYVNDALSTWEPRIQVMGVTITQDTDVSELIHIDISYNITGTNVASNYVYPFFTRPYLSGYGDVQTQ